MGFQSARDKAGTYQKVVVGPEGSFCAVFRRRRVGKVLVVLGLWFFGW